MNREKQELFGKLGDALHLAEQRSRVVFRRESQGGTFIARADHIGPEERAGIIRIFKSVFDGEHGINALGSKARNVNVMMSNRTGQDGRPYLHLIMDLPSNVAKDLEAHLQAARERVKEQDKGRTQ
ncbi:MAG: hypothetical protein V1835_03210 [Candidatus Micrarchaeota archaeon]